MMMWRPTWILLCAAVVVPSHALVVAAPAARLGISVQRRMPAVCLAESEFEYRKRMAEQRDGSKSLEWNQAYARLEKVVPVIVFGKAVGDVNLPDLRAAISDALAAGVEYEEMEKYVKILRDVDDSTKNDDIPALLQAQKAADARREAADQLTIQEDEARRRALRAFSEMQAARPSVIFGNIVGKVDAPAYRAAIDAARDAGVDAADIEEAERLYKLATGGK